MTDPPDRVLVVQTSLLGDLVLTTPLFGVLRQRWPRAHVAVLARPESAPILRPDPDIDEVVIDDKRGLNSGALGLLRLVREIRARRFDVALSLHRATRTALLLALSEIPLRVGFRQSELSFLYHRRVWRDPERHDVERQLSILEPVDLGSADSASSLPRLVVCGGARRTVDELLAREGVGSQERYVVLAPGSSWRSKQWMPESFAEVARSLLERGDTVVYVGAPSETPTVEQIQLLAPGGVNLAGKTDTAGLAAAIARADALICNDSAAMHVAQALSVPLVAIVGPTSPAQGFMPRSPLSAVVSDTTLTCRPRCRYGSLECPFGTRACQHNLTPEQVLAALARVRGLADVAGDATAQP